MGEEVGSRVLDVLKLIFVLMEVVGVRLVMNCEIGFIVNCTEFVIYSSAELPVVMQFE